MTEPEADTEITLGAGRLLGLFFGLVVLCAAFFVVGYRLGRSTTSGTTLTDSPPAGSPAIKPLASQGTITIKPNCASRPEGCEPSAADSNPVAPTLASGNGTATEAPQPANSAATPATADAPPETAKSASGGGYIVQVAAVSKQQDAEALVAALKHKQYQVFVVTPTTDALFHVQIGPFADAKDAEAIRGKLVADGYNPIVKR